MRILASLCLCAATAATLLTNPAHAILIGGVEFPSGASSFADALINYSPVINSGEPTADNRNAGNSLGLPDGNYVSLGDGGLLTLQFVDNLLTGSGSASLDLWIFEVGADVEDTFVEISTDNINYVSVGKVTGATSGIDIDAFGYGPGSLFAYVRLRDDPDEGDQSGPSVGADIDAVGAISTVAAVPEPSTYALFTAGLAGIALVGRHLKRRR